jgi:hypothetical protein
VIPRSDAAPSSVSVAVALDAPRMFRESNANEAIDGGTTGKVAPCRSSSSNTEIVAVVDRSTGVVVTAKSALLAPPDGHLRGNDHRVKLSFQIRPQLNPPEQPIILTSNKAFAEWGEVFAVDPIMAPAALDRLLQPLCRDQHSRR